MGPPHDILPPTLKVLRDVAKRVGKRVSKCKLYDPNVCKSDFLPTKPWMTNWLPGDLFEHQLRFKSDHRQVTIMANWECVQLDLRGFAPVTAMVFSINQPDRVMVTRRLLLHLKPQTWPVFVCRDGSSDSVARWLTIPEHIRLIKQLALGNGESLAVCANALRAYLMRPSADRVMSSFDILGRILDQLPLQESEHLDFTALPEKFRGLESLMRAWAIADDTERCERLSRASAKTLNRLVDTLRPMLNSIGTICAPLATSLCRKRQWPWAHWRNARVRRSCCWTKGERTRPA